MFLTGSSLAIVGDSGAGKSTLINIINTFYSPVSGRYLWNGEVSSTQLCCFGSCLLLSNQDIANYTKASLRQKIALVQQETFLFNGTIRGECSLSSALGFIPLIIPQITFGWEDLMQLMKKLRKLQREQSK